MKGKLSSKLIQTLKTEIKPYEVVDVDLKGFLLRIQPSGVMTYYFSYRTNEGKKKRCKIGKHGSITPVQARDLALVLSAKVISGEDVQERKKQIRHAAEQAKSRTLEGFLNSRYENWVIAERKSGRETIKCVKSIFKELMSYPLEEINHWLIEKWRTERLKLGNKTTTVNRDVSRLKAMLSKAIEWELLSMHPLAKLKSIKTDKQGVVRYLSLDEEKNLREALLLREEQIKKARHNANQWRAERNYDLYLDLNKLVFADYLQPMVLLAMNTGMRRGELFDLTWNDVNFNARVLTVRGFIAKSGKTRHVPLNTEALKVLQDWYEQSEKNGLVFPSKTGERFTHIKKSWAGLMKVANIEKFRFHDLRHHFASKLVMVGVDLNTVRELLGHSDIEMTLRYAHLAPEHKARAVEKLMTGDKAKGTVAKFVTV